MPTPSAAPPLPDPPRPAVAVMQPYLFPYLGTYQLVHAVEAFVHFDDVAFIKKGHIHRNRIALGGEPQAFTVPVRQVSQNRTIAEHEYTGEWRPLLDLLRRAYRGAPHFDAGFALVEQVALDPDENVARKNARSLEQVFAHWGLARAWHTASSFALPPECRGQERILALCERLGARTYVNAAGGRELYEPARFAGRGLCLRFIENQALPYPQRLAGAPAGARDAPFLPHLSVIDVLMHCDPAEARALLGAYRLVA